MTAAIFNDSGFVSTAGIATVYHYDKKTGEYRGSTGEFIQVGVSVPANSTLIAPGANSTGCVWVFGDSKWESEEDHRGETVYSTATAQPVVVKDLGPYPDNTTPQSPDGVPYPVWNGDGWITDTSKESAEVVAHNTAAYNGLMYRCMAAAFPLQSAVALGVATDEQKSRLVALQQYAVDLINPEFVDLNANPATFPEMP